MIVAASHITPKIRPTRLEIVPPAPKIHGFWLKPIGNVVQKADTPVKCPIPWAIKTKASNHFNNIYPSQNSLSFLIKLYMIIDSKVFWQGSKPKSGSVDPERLSFACVYRDNSRALKQVQSYNSAIFRFNWSCHGNYPRSIPVCLEIHPVFHFTVFAVLSTDSGFYRNHLHVWSAGYQYPARDRERSFFLLPFIS